MRALLLISAIALGLVAGLTGLAIVADTMAGDDGGPCGSPLYCDTFQGPQMAHPEPAIATGDQGDDLAGDVAPSPKTAF